MTTDRFDGLVLVLGVATVAGSLAVTVSSQAPAASEVIAQVALVFVLLAAVKGGAKAGTIAAVGASALYVVMRLPDLSQIPIEPTVLGVVISRFAAYGLVGIGGGEICARMRFALAGLEDTASIDDWSQVYNQTHAATSIGKAVGRFTRYGEEFSLILVSVSPSVLTGLRPLRQRGIVRSVANHLRTDVRLVDEVARLEDGRFAVLLPHTPHAGAEVVRERISTGVIRLLGSRPETVTTKVLSAPTDVEALSALARSLAETDEA